jgi:hypothetical protein
VPAGYYRFTDPTGFSIGVPAGWRVSHVGHYVYVRDPANRGIFLIIDQSGQPKPDPLADWRQQAAARQSSYPDYHLVTLRAVSYPQAEKAADWEFTYKRNGVIIQVLNRNILANAHHAYALYWTTPASQWSAYYHYFQVFAATFKPASPLHTREPLTETVDGLVSGRRLELDHQFGRYPAAVLYLDALRPGPLADFGGVQPVCRCLAPATRLPPDTAADPAASTSVGCQRVAKRLGVFGVQVDLVVGAV